MQPKSILPFSNTGVARRLAEAVPRSGDRNHHLTLPALRSAEEMGFYASLVDEEMDDAVLDDAMRRPEVLFSLIQSSARRLGDEWVADKIDFTDVTIRSSRLHGLLTDYRRTLTSQASGPAIAVVSQPWDDHILGATVLDARLNHAGFATELFLSFDARMLRGFDAVFLSATNTDRVEELAHVVREIRAAVGPDIPIIVGGRAVDGLDAEALGADLVSSSLSDALEFCARETGSQRFLI